MKDRVVRGLMWLAITLSGATVFQVGFTSTTGAFQSCERFTSNGVLTSVDFCYILDCDGGFLGGAVQPCGDSSTTADDLLVDCPGSSSDSSDTSS
jgi:hypothetical protein